MKTGKLEWSYRLGIRPGPYAHAEIESAVRYALDAGMTDICLFLNGEEMNTGFFTDEELTACLDIAARLKTALAGTALTLSVNPWNTLLHGDRGRQLKPGQNFRTMVDVNGKAAGAVACPLCENWRQWLLGAYTRIAAEIRPNIIWVEDDFRLHNHDGLEWGGCFCEAHMAAYSRRLGLETPVGRTDFLARVTDAEPNAYRMVWLDTHRDTMNELAALLENAVHSVSPETRLALMSSLPAQHCAEGRDWHGILNGLAGGHKPINRIHLPAYAETWPAEYMRAFSMISLCVRAMCPADTQVLPELENYPYSRFIKSRAFTRFQVESAAPLNLAGMTLDLFDIMGGGLMPGEGYQDVLPQSFEFIARMNETGAFGAAHAGVCVPVSSRASYHLHARGGGMPGLYPRETFLGGLLGTLGVPVYYLADAIPQNTISAVSGQWLRNLTKDEIERFFATNRVLLDGEAADTLFRLGLGHLAGIRAVCWHRQDSGAANYEQAASPCLGLPQPACSAQVMAGDYLQIDYDGGKAELLSQVYNWRREASGPGVALACGKVLVLPYGRFGEWVRKHFHPVRQALMQDGLRRLGADLFCENGRNLFPFARVMPDGRTALYLVNASLDAARGLEWHTGGRRAARVEVLRRGGGLLCEGLDLCLEPLECALLLVEWEVQG